MKGSVNFPKFAQVGCDRLRRNERGNIRREDFSRKQKHWSPFECGDSIEFLREGLFFEDLRSSQRNRKCNGE